MDRFDDAMNFKYNNHSWHKNVFISRSMYLIGVAHTTVDICATYLTGEFIRPHSELLGACWAHVGALLNVDD